MPARLLCVGEAFDDLVFMGLDCFPGPGEELRTDSFQATTGGGAVITAVAAARLGTSVTLASALSDNAVRRLRQERVQVKTLRKRGEPHAISVALSTPTERAFVTFDAVNRTLEARLRPVLRSTRASHVHAALYPRDTHRFRRDIEALGRRGITTSCDVGWNDALAKDEGLTRMFDAFDLVFVNEREAALYADADSLDHALAFWRRRAGTTVIKLGADGSRAVGHAGDAHAPARPVKAIDTTGAGDAFNGGFLAAWLRGASLAECLRTGNRVGAASTRKAGGLDALPIARRPQARRTAHARPR